MGAFPVRPRGGLKKFWYIPVLLALGAALAVFACQPVMTLRLTYQKTGEVILEQRVHSGDAVTVELTHSFEHVPWNEYYLVQKDGSFLLQRIEVGGFGAGIPAEMDVPTYVGEDGLVHMDDINTVFPCFNWITSQTNMKDLLLNGQAIFTFDQIPHHSFVACEIQVQRRFLFWLKKT
jgi:hypothetical protein